MMSEYQTKLERYRKATGNANGMAEQLVERLAAPPFDPQADASPALASLLRGEGAAELPVASLMELERFYRHAFKARRLTRGLERLAAHCPDQLVRWLRLAPHRLCRVAFVLGGATDDRALKRSLRHSLFLIDQSTEWTVHGLVRSWYPLRPPQLICDCADADDPNPRLREEIQRSLERWLELGRLEVLMHYLKSGTSQKADPHGINVG